jgi:hypothetical protein
LTASRTEYLSGSGSRMADIVTRSNSSVNWGSGKKILSRVKVQVRDPIILRCPACSVFFNIHILPTERICILHLGLRIYNHFSVDDRCSGAIMCLLWGTNWDYIYLFSRNSASKVVIRILMCKILIPRSLIGGEMWSKIKTRN